MEKVPMYRLALVVIASLLSSAASAGVVAEIDKSQQVMTVYVNGSYAYSWSISTGRGGYNTPVGSFRPTFLSRNHRSSRYGGAPMPYSVFFHRGYAIHGTYEVRALGRPASHGCIRLHPESAREFYSLVQSYGRGATRIVIRR
ncbi:MAG: L,D-transpeptidase [Chitinophagales bacterium]|nr:L,D-transpeptidase [Hyphomicrobiales bacterium]